MKLTFGILGTLLLVYLTGAPAGPAPPRSTPAPPPDPFAFVRPVADPRPAPTPPVLLIDPALRNLFDFYLAAMADQDSPMTRDEAGRDLAQKFTPAAAVEATLLLARYLDYANALRAAARPGQAARATLQARHQLRLRYFSAAEYARLFAFEDASDMDTLKRMEIVQDAQLGNSQKQSALAALDRALPAVLRAEREQSQGLVKLEESIAALRAAGASEDEIYRKRALAISPEAAAQLAELERTNISHNGDKQ